MTNQLVALFSYYIFAMINRMNENKIMKKDIIKVSNKSI